jgi:predicted  nucleic acid-binding Zn-ribbon protein
MLMFYQFQEIFDETDGMIPLDDEECNEMKQVLDLHGEDYFRNASKANEASGHLKNTIDHLNKDLDGLREKIASKTEISNAEKAAFVVTLLPKLVEIQHEFEAYSSSVDVNLEKVEDRREKVKELLTQLRMCAEHNYPNHGLRI